MPAAIIGPAALAITALALVCGALALARTRRPALALGVFLDLLVAAGLLRLSGRPDWQTIATAAALLVIRRLIGFGLRTGGRTWSGTGGTGRRAGVLRSPAVQRLLRPAWRL